MDKQNVIYLCARISFNHKEGMKHWHTLHYEWTLNTRRRVKEADHERAQIVWFCLYWNIQNRRIHGDKQIDGCQGLGILRKMGSNFSRIWSFSGEERCHVIKLTVIMDHQGEYTKSHWIEHIWWMNCMICELYLNKLLPKKKKEEGMNKQRNKRHHKTGWGQVVMTDLPTSLIITSHPFNLLKLTERQVQISSVNSDEKECYISLYYLKSSGICL